MSTANIRELISALAFRKQADISTLPGAANFFTLSRTNTALATVDPKTEDDALDIGKGHEWPNNVFPLNVDGSVPYEKYASSEIFAFLGAFGLGTSVKTVPEAGAFTYTCTPLDPVTGGIELPFTAYIEAIRQGGSALVDRALVGSVIQDWGFELNSGAGRQNSKVTFNLAASGKVTQPSGVTIPAAFVEHGLNAGSAAITILGQNYITLKRLVSLSFQWQNNIRLEQGLYPGSGVDGNGFQIRGRLENGDRAVSCNFKVRLESTSTELANLLSQTEGTAVISLTGALITGTTFHGMTLTLHRVRISAAVVDDDQGIVTVSVTLRPLYHSSNGLLTLAATCELDNIGAAAA